MTDGATLVANQASDIFFQTVATVAVTVAGFTGFLALYRESGGKPLINEKLGRNLILEVSLSTVGWSLLPFIFHALVPRFEWLFASTLLAMYLGGSTHRYLRQVQTLYREHKDARTPKKVTYALLVVSCCITGAQILNAGLWHLVGVYEIGVLFTLGFACYQFVLFAIMPSEVPKPIILPPGDSADAGFDNYTAPLPP